VAQGTGAWSPTRQGTSTYYPAGLYVGPAAGHVAKTALGYSAASEQRAGGAQVTTSHTHRAAAKAWVVQQAATVTA